MALQLRSAAFAPGAPLPKRYTMDGADLSPAVEWRGVPAGTKELALVLEDPDAPGTTPWIHWLVYGIPSSSSGLPEGVPAVRTLTQGSGIVQGSNSWKCIGYRGPAPPPGRGTHHYRFVLYALDAPIHLDPGVDGNALRAAMGGHVLERAELTGTYSR